MKKIIFICALLFMLGVQAMAFEIGVGGGAYIPTGKDAKDIYDTGYNVNAFMDFNIISIFGIRFLADYYEADGKDNGINYNMKGYGGGAMLMFKPEFKFVTPYVGAGYGAHRTEWGPKNSHGGNHHGGGSSNTYGSKEKEWGHGIIAQAGMNFHLYKALTLGINATYFMNDADGDKLDGVNLGGTLSLAF